jgi:hypothetical protein
MNQQERQLDNKELKQRTVDMKRTLTAYNNVFSSPEGLLVLSHIMKETGVFSTDAYHTPETMALRNYGAKLLSRCTFQMPDLIGAMTKDLLNKAKQIDSKTLDHHIQNLITGGS